MTTRTDDPRGAAAAAPSGAAVWDTVAQVLRSEGIDAVYGLPDDDMLAARAAADRGLDLLWTEGQRSAVAMATGAALAGHGVQVCLLGRGPAVTVALAGLTEAWHSGAPVVLLTAGTATSRLLDRAFQDAPTLDSARPFTRWAVRVPDSAALVPTLRAALARAAGPPGGPVLVEIPDDLPGVLPGLAAGPRPIPASAAPDILSRSERPLVLLGGGARAAGVAGLMAAAGTAGAGVLVTASGRGAVDEGLPGFLGVAGLYMTAPVAELTGRADLVVALGSRLEETALTGMPLTASWLQVNLAVEDIDFSLPGHYAVADAADVAALLTASMSGAAALRSPWRAALGDAAAEARRLVTRAGESPGARAVAALTDNLPPGAVVIHENGLHDIWSYVAPLLRLPTGGRSVAPSEQTTLGFGVAAAAGIAAREDSLVVCVCGDGAFGTFAPDLRFLSRHRMRLLYLVLDDGGFGWLDRQARGAGVALSFRRAPTGPGGDMVAGLVRAAGLSLIDASGAGSGTDVAGDLVASAVVEGVRLAATGQVTVVRVLCDPADVPVVLVDGSQEAAP